MNPNANLNEQLELAEYLACYTKHGSEAQRLAELVLEMNGWLTNGGFLPDQWKRHRSNVNITTRAHIKLAQDIQKITIASKWAGDPKAV